MGHDEDYFTYGRSSLSGKDLDRFPDPLYVFMSGEGVEEGDLTCACHDEDYYNFTTDEDYYYTYGRSSLTGIIFGKDQALELNYSANQDSTYDWSLQRGVQRVNRL